MSGPLADVTVLEVANFVAVPSCGALLADLGARVVKVEPPTGDPLRGSQRPPRLAEGRPATDFAYQLDNRGKRSLAVDLADERGAALVRELAGRVDVLLTNLLPARLARFGLGPEQLLAAHPRLVYGLVTGYGRRGPDADKPGFDLTAFFARSGLMDLVGEPAGPPAQFRPGQGDHTTGLALLAGVLAALRERDRTGVGQLVETALLRSAAWTLGCDLSAVLVDHRAPSNRGRHGTIGPMNTTYRCGDGVWVNLAARDQTAWPRFATALGRPDLAADQRYATNQGRFRHRGELITALDEQFATQPYEYWAPRLDESGVVWAKVARVEELPVDPQALANDMFATVEHPTVGPFPTLAAPFTLEPAQVAVRGRAPEVGEHSTAVLAELGVAPERVRELLADGVVAVGSAPSA